MNFAKLTFCHIFLIINITLLSLSLHASIDIKKLDEKLKESIAFSRLPGLAVAIVNDKEVLFQSAYGVQIEADTSFFLGSTTKSFTALAIMILSEKGLLDIDSPIKKYLPDFQLNDKKNEGLITVRHLLNQTSGLSEIGLPFSTLGGQSLTEEMKLLQYCTIKNPPGTKFEYFNGNYRLLGLLIERISGMTYGDFLKQEIFSPLQMNSTFAGLENPPKLAPGHVAFLGYPLKRTQEYRKGALSSAFISSTISDLSKFLIFELQQAWAINSSQNPTKQILIPHNTEDESYAMGWLSVKEKPSKHFFVHGGTLENYQSFFYLSPQSNIAFVMLANQSSLLPNGFQQAQKIIVNAIEGKEQQPFKTNMPNLIFMVVLAIVVVLQLLSFLRLKNWIDRIRPKRKWKWISWICIDCALSLFMLFGFTPLLRLLSGEYIDFVIIYRLIPELWLLLILIGSLGVLRTLIKLSLLKFHAKL